jgi:hypothetical protein
LRKKIFPEVYKKLSRRSAARAAEREGSRDSDLQQTISDSLGAKVSLRHASTARLHPPVAVERAPHQVQITFGDLSQMRTAKEQRQLAAAILSLYEVASQERDASLRRERFEELLLTLLARW